MDHQQQRPQPEPEYNAVFRDLLGGDARVLFGLLVVGGLGLGLLYVLVAEESGPPADRVAACAAWEQFRAEPATDASDHERLEQLAALERDHRHALPEPSTFDGAHAELAEGGEHFENYARRLDASCSLDG